MSQTTIQRNPNTQFTMTPDGSLSCACDTQDHAEKVEELVSGFGTQDSQNQAHVSLNSESNGISGIKGYEVLVSGVDQPSVRAAGYRVVTPNFLEKDDQLILHTDNPFAAHRITEYFKKNAVTPQLKQISKDGFDGLEISIENTPRSIELLAHAHYKANGQLVTKDTLKQSQQKGSGELGA